MKYQPKLIPILLACLLGVVSSQRSQADEYTDLTKQRVEKALVKGAKKDAIRLAEGSLTALGWFVLYGKDKASVDQANELAKVVSDAYNGTEKMDIYMKHTSEAYAEMLNLRRFEGRPTNPSDEYEGITKKRVNAALAKEAGQKEFRLAEGSLCALGWFTLYGNGKMSVDTATKLMNAAATAWPGANEVYMQQSFEAYTEMLNLGRFKQNKPLAPVTPTPVAQIDNELKVTSEKSCMLALISETAAAGKQHGWWSVWSEQKKNGGQFKSPHTFSGLKPGVYTLIAFDPASANYDPNNGNPDEASDGVVLEKVTITSDCKLSYSFKKGDFKDWNCLSCPWLYVDSGKGYVRTTEVLQDVVGAKNETTTSFTIAAGSVVSRIVKIRLQEEKDEITYLDRCVINIDGVDIPAIADSSVNKRKLAADDDNFVVLKKGESIDLKFTLPSNWEAASPIVLKTTGFYEPDAEFLKSVYKKYQRSAPQAR